MKNLFAKAVAQVDAAHAAQPISGNEDALSEIFAKVYKRSQEQGFGLAQLISAKSFVEAANAQQGEINEIITAVKAELNSASCRFDNETKQFIENALAKGPDELARVLIEVSQKVTSTESVQVGNPLPEIPQVSDPGVTEPSAASNVVPLVSVPAETSDQPACEDELKQLLAACDWLPVKLPQEPYSIMGLPASTFDRLWGAFNVRTKKSESELRAAHLLDEIKSIRDGESVQKVGWKVMTS